MVRGSKHWPLSKQKIVWDWLTPRLPAIFEGITPETQIAWEMCAECQSPSHSPPLRDLTDSELYRFSDILNARDPRRNQPLVDYFTSLSIDKDSSEAFNVAKKQDREFPSVYWILSQRLILSLEFDQSSEPL